MTARLVVQVQPRASRSEVTGRFGDAVKIRLAAPPVDGAANEELVRFVAELLKVPKSAVTITAGLTSKRKTLQIVGVSPEAVNEIAS